MGANSLGNCRDVEEFEKLNRIGEGTYGTVYRARDKRTGQIVALKRVLLHNEQQDGFPVTALREIKLLQRVTHRNCVKLLDVVVGQQRSSVFLVFEYCDHDLGNLLDTAKHSFSEAEFKRIMLQLLRAVQHLHDQFMIHRDLKMSNLLYTAYGQLKLADFGLAREFGVPLTKMSPKVVTLWYRAPELLLGTSLYTTAIDLWACGCIFAELWLRQPFLPGQNELQQLQLIFELLGSPNDRIWPELGTLPNIHQLNFNPQKYQYNQIKTRFPTLSAQGQDLLNQMLVYNPSKRITASMALEHPYFQEHPLPTEESLMPTFPTTHPKR